MVSELWQKEAPPCAFFPSLPTLGIAQRGGLCGAESLPRNLFARGVCVCWIMRRKFVKCVR